MKRYSDLFGKTDKTPISEESVPDTSANTVTVVNSGEEPPEEFAASVFLAGPTPRKGEAGWRGEALEALRNAGFAGTVFVPEPRAGSEWPAYSDQVEWEDASLNMSDVILFWIPRDMDGMPGLTTNDEFGRWKGTGKVVLGTPPDAQHVRYQEHYAKKLGIPTFHSLAACAEQTVRRVGSGLSRTLGERSVPLHVAMTPQWQAYSQSVEAAGNRIDEARLEWATPADKPFVTAVWAKIWIASEGRHKENEVVVSRPDISSAVLLHRATDLLDSKIVTVSEFRTPVRNPSGAVCELPGGSSHTGQDQLITAAEEVEEETGLKLDASRLKKVGSRQLAATLSSHANHVYMAELTAEEMATVERGTAGKTFGVAEDSERTTVSIKTVRELLSSEDADWTNVGAVLSALLAY